METTGTIPQHQVCEAECREGAFLRREVGGRGPRRQSFGRHLSVQGSGLWDLGNLGFGSCVEGFGVLGFRALGLSPWSPW